MNLRSSQNSHIEITTPRFRIVLASTYEMGRQPFALGSAAAWLSRIGATVQCIDLSCTNFDEDDFKDVDLVAFHLPMHTATRLTSTIAPKVAELSDKISMCAFGLYAAGNESFLQGLGIRWTIAGEFESGLTELAKDLMIGKEPAQQSSHSLDKLKFISPDRRTLPDLKHYAQLQCPDGSRKIVGYTEASRGCKHLCKHCPVVPVYNGVFRIVQRDVVLEDIRNQVALGAEHITFGDPDFFNGITHAMKIVKSIHDEFPDLSYDVTIKIEHLLKHSEHLSTLVKTGCAFVITAVEAVDDQTLEHLDKGHTRADFIRAVALCRQSNLIISPTFVTFTPWLTVEGFRDMLSLIADLDLVSAIAPVQWAIRLLLPQGSKLLDTDDVKAVIKNFNEESLVHEWAHSDYRVDQLFSDVERTVKEGLAAESSRETIFRNICQLVVAKNTPISFWDSRPAQSNSTIPYLTEPWYC